MKSIKHFIILIYFIFFASTCQKSQEPIISENINISNIIDGVKFETGNWQPDLPAGQKGGSLGNHRVVIKTEAGFNAVWVHIPWRRNDSNPNNKALVIINAKSNKEVRNKIIMNINNETADIIFQPDESTNKYFLYYMPYQTSGGYYPTVSYRQPEFTADKNWLKSSVS